MGCFGMAKDKIKMEIREDGIYMALDNSDSASRPNRKEVLEYIAEYNLSNIDQTALNDLLNSTEEMPEAKVSSSTGISKKDESVTFNASKDRMEAFVIFAPAEYGGALLTYDEVLDQINRYGIHHGILEEEVQVIVEKRNVKAYGVEHKIAEGTPVLNGADGELIYNFDVTGKKNQPKILLDGTVDFKQLGYFTSVKAGQILAYRTLPTTGAVGIDVFGRAVNQKPGKAAPKFSKGKNVYVTDDEMELKAQISGELVVSGKNIGVSPVLEVKGDVGYETGNINFEGSVNVHGNVLSGFTLEALGNIEVKGIVEGAQITAVGAVNLYGGIQGMNKSKITAGGNVFAKFAQNTTIEAGGDIKSNALLHSNIKCGGSIVLEGDNRLIVGGNITAGREINARTIGSPVGTQTTVRAGNNPELFKKYDELREAHKETKEKYDKINKDYDAITKAGGLEQLDNRRKRMLLQLVNNRMALRKEVLKCEEDLLQMGHQLKMARGRVSVEKVIYHGATLYIGNATLHLEDEITASTFRNEGGKIAVRPQ